MDYKFSLIWYSGNDFFVILIGLVKRRMVIKFGKIVFFFLGLIDFDVVINCYRIIKCRINGCILF